MDAAIWGVVGALLGTLFGVVGALLIARAQGEREDRREERRHERAKQEREEELLEAEDARPFEALYQDPGRLVELATSIANERDSNARIVPINETSSVGGRLAAGGVEIGGKGAHRTALSTVAVTMRRFMMSLAEAPPRMTCGLRHSLSRSTPAKLGQRCRPTARRAARLVGSRALDAAPRPPPNRRGPWPLDGRGCWTVPL